MNYISITRIILLKVIISNIIIVNTSNELRRGIENYTSVTIDDLKILIRRYPGFIKLKLQQQDYYTGKDVFRCPLPYNNNTTLDDPDVVGNEFFNPRKCSKPWTWTQKNYVDVPVPINDTINKKLGNIIQPCLKGNANIIQCYTHYLNVMESVGLTLVDRFCLFTLEVFDRFENMNDDVDFTEEFSLFDVKYNMQTVYMITENCHLLLKYIHSTFTEYYISTLPLDCIESAMEDLTSKQTASKKHVIECNKQLAYCREIMKSKKNYAVLENDQYWKWDISSDSKPDDSLIIYTIHANNELGFRLFTPNEHMF